MPILFVQMLSCSTQIQRLYSYAPMHSQNGNDEYEEFSYKNTGIKTHVLLIVSYLL